MEIFRNRGQLVVTGQSDLLHVLADILEYEHATDTTDEECEKVMKEKPEVNDD